MKKTILILSMSLVIVAAKAQLGPEITSWVINTTNATGYNNIPSNVQLVQYSTNNVYVSCTCIPGYSIGPWNQNPNQPGSGIANQTGPGTTGLGSTGFGASPVGAPPNMGSAPFGGGNRIGATPSR